MYKVTDSRTFKIASEEVAPGRFLGDHQKARQGVPIWTEKFFGYFLLMLRTGKLKGTTLGRQFAAIKKNKPSASAGATVEHASVKAQSKQAFERYRDAERMACG